MTETKYTGVLITLIQFLEPIVFFSGTENCKDRKIAKFNLHFHLYGHFYNMQIGKILALADFAA